MRYAIFGLGSSLYSPRYFCKAAKDIDTALKRLGARRVTPRVSGDDALGTIEAAFETWSARVVDVLLTQHRGESAGGGEEVVDKRGEDGALQQEEEEEEEEEEEDEEDEEEQQQQENDLEDLAGADVQGQQQQLYNVHIHVSNLRWSRQS